ncbi:MAG TPA: hypothetical protein VF570_08760 [Pyrinomonadaceae bacterium]
MTNWMRRRIERSRARCDRAATTHKSDKEQGADGRPKLSAAGSPADDAKRS